MRLALLLAASLLSAQSSVAVFNGANANFKSMTIGASHVYIWARLPAPWPIVVACYDSTVTLQVQGVNLNATRTGQGDCHTADGYFTWLFKPNGVGVDWDVAGTPVGGISNEQKGSF